ncbi:MAG: hypothetical protein DMG91_15100 [Acidobacteria bacterium]|jgi:hypothetical protein|nr:MAG: hypothetical protein DMG91_15100 [Acidobacteriota bacterium]
MRKLAGVAIVLILMSLAASAQESKAEVFGGYQYSNLDGTGLNGWNAAVTGNVKDWLGITGDFSGGYNNTSGVSFRNYTYTFGPTISSSRNQTFRLFAHGLFGGFHDSASFGGFSGSGSGFAMMFGGGVDAKIKPHMAVRVGQFDWMSFRANGNSSSNNFRYSAGLVFHL